MIILTTKERTKARWVESGGDIASNWTRVRAGEQPPDDAPCVTVRALSLAEFRAATSADDSSSAACAAGLLSINGQDEVDVGALTFVAATHIADLILTLSAGPLLPSRSAGPGSDTTPTP